MRMVLPQQITPQTSAPENAVHLAQIQTSPLDRLDEYLPSSCWIKFYYNQ